MNVTENIELKEKSDLYLLEEDPTILNAEKYETILRMGNQNTNRPPRD